MKSNAEVDRIDQRASSKSEESYESLELTQDQLTLVGGGTRRPSSPLALD